MSAQRRQPPYWLVVLALVLTIVALAIFFVLVTFTGRFSPVTQAYQWVLVPAMFLWTPLALVGIPTMIVEAVVAVLQLVYFWIILWAVWWVVAGRRR